MTFKPGDKVIPTAQAANRFGALEVGNEYTIDVVDGFGDLTLAGIEGLFLESSFVLAKPSEPDTTIDYKEKYETLARLVVPWAKQYAERPTWTGATQTLYDAAREIEKELTPVDPRIAVLIEELKALQPAPDSWEDTAVSLLAKLDELP